MDGKRLLIEGGIVVAYWLIERLIGRLFHRRRWHLNWLWALLFMALAEWNLGFYWFAYPLIGWMAGGIILVFVQLIARREFLYRRYWPAFWRLSFFYSVLVLAASLALTNLPQP